MERHQDNAKRSRKSSLSQCHLCTGNTGVPGVKATGGHAVSALALPNTRHHNVLSITFSSTKGPLHWWPTSKNKPVCVSVSVCGVSSMTQHFQVENTWGVKEWRMYSNGKYSCKVQQWNILNHPIEVNADDSLLSSYEQRWKCLDNFHYNRFVSYMCYTITTCREDLNVTNVQSNDKQMLQKKQIKLKMLQSQNDGEWRDFMASYEYVPLCVASCGFVWVTLALLCAIFLFFKVHF